MQPNPRADRRAVDQVLFAGLVPKRHDRSLLSIRQVLLRHGQHGVPDADELVPFVGAVGRAGIDVCLDVRQERRLTDHGDDALGFRGPAGELRGVVKRPGLHGGQGDQEIGQREANRGHAHVPENRVLLIVHRRGDRAHRAHIHGQHEAVPLGGAYFECGRGVFSRAADVYRFPGQGVSDGQGAVAWEMQAHRVRVAHADVGLGRDAYDLLAQLHHRPAVLGKREGVHVLRDRDDRVLCVLELVAHFLGDLGGVGNRTVRPFDHTRVRQELVDRDVVRPVQEALGRVIEGRAGGGHKVPHVAVLVAAARFRVAQRGDKEVGAPGERVPGAGKVHGLEPVERRPHVEMQEPGNEPATDIEVLPEHVLRAHGGQVQGAVGVEPDQRSALRNPRHPVLQGERELTFLGGAAVRIRLDVEHAGVRNLNRGQRLL